MQQAQKTLDFYPDLCIMVTMMNNKGNKLKTIAFSAVEFVWKASWAILLAPFLIPAFLIVKLLGGNTFSLDDMGLGFMLTIFIAIGIAVAAGFFFLGTLI